MMDDADFHMIRRPDGTFVEVYSPPERPAQPKRTAQAPCPICLWDHQHREALEAEFEHPAEVDTIDAICRRHMTTPEIVVGHIAVCLGASQALYMAHHRAQQAVERMLDAIENGIPEALQKAVDLLARAEQEGKTPEHVLAREYNRLASTRAAISAQFEGRRASAEVRTRLSAMEARQGRVLIEHGSPASKPITRGPTVLDLLRSKRAEQAAQRPSDPIADPTQGPDIDPLS